MNPVTRLFVALSFTRRTDKSWFGVELVKSAFAAFMRYSVQKRLVRETEKDVTVNWLNWRENLQEIYPYDKELMPNLDEIEKELEDEETRQRVKNMKLRDIYNDVRAFTDPLNHFTKSYRLFRANDGYLGIVPKTTEPLDRICVFGGASTVFVVRKVSEVSNRWRIIGEAFMQNVVMRSDPEDIELE